MKNRGSFLYTSIAFFLAINLSAILAAAQTSSPQDVTAAALLRSSLSAMTKGAVLSDVTLQMIGAQTVGPDTTSATGAFYGRIDGNTRLDFDAGSGMQAECHVVVDDRHRLYRRDATGKITKGALHAAWVSNMWLAPPLALTTVLQHGSCHA